VRGCRLQGATRTGGRPARHHTPQVKQRREEADAKRTQPDFKARRRVVERTHTWVNRFRKLLVSFEKNELSYTGLLGLAAAMICWRKTIFYLRLPTSLPLGLSCFLMT
jgi:transposase